MAFFFVLVNLFREGQDVKLKAACDGWAMWPSQVSTALRPVQINNASWCSEPVFEVQAWSCTLEKWFYNDGHMVNLLPQPGRHKHWTEQMSHKSPACCSSLTFITEFPSVLQSACPTQGRRDAGLPVSRVEGSLSIASFSPNTSPCFLFCQTDFCHWTGQGHIITWHGFCNIRLL